MPDMPSLFIKLEFGFIISIHLGNALCLFQAVVLFIVYQNLKEYIFPLYFVIEKTPRIKEKIQT